MDHQQLIGSFYMSLSASPWTLVFFVCVAGCMWFTSIPVFASVVCDPFKGWELLSQIVNVVWTIPRMSWEAREPQKDTARWGYQLLLVITIRGPTWPVKLISEPSVPVIVIEPNVLRNSVGLCPDSPSNLAPGRRYRRNTLRSTNKAMGNMIDRKAGYLPVEIGAA